MKTLVILEMANNHMGSIDHAKKIIKKFSYITKLFNNFFCMANVAHMIVSHFKDHQSFHYSVITNVLLKNQRITF